VLMLLGGRPALRSCNIYFVTWCLGGDSLEAHDGIGLGIFLKVGPRLGGERPVRGGNDQDR
jgi:hypothetical protein